VEFVIENNVVKVTIEEIKKFEVFIKSVEYLRGQGDTSRRYIIRGRTMVL